jgi:GST-like protein
MTSDPEGLELYACMTPNVLKVMLMLGELDRPFALRHVRVYRGETFADGFERLHPYRKLPVLVDHAAPGGPHTVFESGAILMYLAEQAGALLGEDALERSRATQWLMLQMSSLGPIFGQAIHFRRSGPASEPYARRRFLTQAVRLCELYDARLGEAAYLAGEAFTVADVATFPWLWRHPQMLGLNPAAYPNLSRWVGDIEQRTGLQRVHGRYREMVAIDRADLAQADPDLIDRFLGRGGWFREA